MTTKDTELDLLLFGATGFTGKLVAEYLVKKRVNIRWALAGRSASKLEEVRASLATIDPAAAKLPLVVGDAMDAAAVDAMVKRTKVVCTTVGPYGRYGRALVAACAEHGVAYCDLTGETLFMSDMIAQHHERAQATGARIVHTCGFDSIPSDLGVLMLHDHFKSRGKRLAEAHCRVLAMKGGASGGTIASALDMASQIGDPSVRRKLGDPYSLNPAGAARGSDRNDALVPFRDAATGRWTGPFVMAAVNTRVVRRSNALLGFPYGEDFRYDEATDTGKGLKGLLVASAMSVVLGGGMALLAANPTRNLLTRVLPKPGEGPSREQRENGYFKIGIRGAATDGSKANALIVGTNDPGYGETAKMLGESALFLVENEATRGGVLTPASAMGMPLVERLRAAGMTWEVTEQDS